MGVAVSEPYKSLISNQYNSYSPPVECMFITMLSDDGTLYRVLYSDRAFAPHGTIEVTMDQISEKFGIPVDQLKIKNYEN